MFERAGLEFNAVQAESGMMGGKESVDFLAPSGSGQNTLVTCENGDYAADLEIARGIPRPAGLPEPLDSPSEIATPGATTIEALAAQLGIDEAATSKAMPVVKTDGTLVLALVRGDDRLSEPKLVGVLESDYRPATEEEIRDAFGAGGGSLGPVGVGVDVIADEALREGQYVAGANRDGWHLLGVQAGRDYEPRFADIREAVEGDRCPACGGALRFQTAIEVGHIFKFGTRYSEPLGATFLDEDGLEKPLIGGSYGVGPARVMAAAVEQGHDENGIVWPRSIAPYDAHVLALTGAPRRCSPRPRRWPQRSRTRGSTSSWTTATSAPARSSPTRTWSARRSVSSSGRRPSRTARSTSASGTGRGTTASRARKW